MENRIYLWTLSVRLFFRTEIRTYGNTNIKKRLIRFWDKDKSRTDKVRRINNSHTWKRSLTMYINILHGISAIYMQTRQFHSKWFIAAFSQIYLSENWHYDILLILMLIFIKYTKVIEREPVSLQ